MERGASTFQQRIDPIRMYRGELRWCCDRHVRELLDYQAERAKILSKGEALAAT